MTPAQSPQVRVNDERGMMNKTRLIIRPSSFITHRSSFPYG